MKFIAILKDSLREAIDAKIFYVTMAVAVLVVLFVFSLSFRIVPVEEQLNGMAARLNTVLDLVVPQGQQRPRMAIANFSQTNESAPDWQRQYRFQFVMEFPDDLPEDERKGRGKNDADQFKRNLQHELPWAKEMTVTPVEDAKPNEVRFQVEIPSTNVTNRLGWTNEPGLLFGLLPLRWFQGRLENQIVFITDYVVGTFGAAFTLILSVVVTAFFIPNMLRKGTIDLLLAKPIHRSTLLMYKFVGGTSFMFLNTAVIMIGIWLALGLRAGVWMNGMLLCIFIFTFQFAIFYAISTFVAVTTRSPIVAILTSVLAWGLFFGVGWGYRIVDAMRPEKLAKHPETKDFTLPGWLYTTADVVHFVTPHYKDLDVLTTKLIRSDIHPPDSEQMKSTNEAVGSINWTESLIVTTSFIILLVGSSCWWFATKDY